MALAKAKIGRIFDKLAASIPAPKSELNYKNPFQLLVAVILSAQATDISVNAATGPLYEAAPTPEAILKLGEAGLHSYIRKIGLANSKARNVLKTCRVLIDQYDGEVPDTREGLEALAGVGRKTANVVLNVAFGQPTIAVDTHVFRIGNRTGMAPGKTVEKVEEGLLKVTPKRHMMEAHHYLILHGRYTCKARKPECSNCIIEKECGFAEKVFEQKA